MPFSKQTVFGPEQLETMTTAFIAAERTLVAKFGEARREEIRTVLADAIVALASGGLDDAEKLRMLAEARCDGRLTKI